MTEKYTPEKVAELVADVQRQSDDPHQYGPGAVEDLRDRLADALTAVSAERDRLHKAITEALATAPKLGELRWRNVDRMIGILRAALDKEGRDS